MAIQFENQYGKATLTPVTPFMAVRAISAARCPEARAHSIDMEMAEQLALITGNDGIQICFSSFDVIYVIAHDTPRTAAICAVTIQSFSCEAATPAEQLVNCAKRLSCQHLHFTN